MRMNAMAAALVGACLGASAAHAQTTLFSEDFSSDPRTNGKWDVRTSANPRAAHDAASQTFYLTQVGGEWSGISMMARTSLKTHRWEASFHYRAGSPFTDGADGLVFLFYKKGDYTPGYGGYLGFNPPDQQQPGYGIVIDSHHNNWDPDGDFIGLISNTSHTRSDKLAYVNDWRTEDGQWHAMRVRFVDGEVSVYLDGGLLFTHTLAAPDYTFDGVGFSAGMAASQNDHQIDDFVLTELAPPAWSATGRMHLERGLHTASRLPGNKVLVVGGFNSAAEVYDAARGTWRFTGSASTSRLLPTATALGNGQVLVTGGENDGRALATAELYNPASGTFSPAAPLSVGRKDHAAVALADGRVLITGGSNESSGALSSSELFVPGSGRWFPTGFLSAARSQHEAVSLPNGRALVVGGQGASGEVLRGAEVFNPSTGAWSATGSLATGRRFHTATALEDGRVLVVGGYDANGQTLASAELYNPLTGTWSAAGQLAQGRRYHTATRLKDGQVLVAGGYSDWYGVLATTELYDPATGVWTKAPSLGLVRYDHTSTLLEDGRVLTAGGFSTGAQASSELYGLELP